MKKFACVICMLIAVPVCADTIPSPAQHFGHEVGADRTLIPYPDVLAYLELVAAASDRVSIEEAGASMKARSALSRSARRAIPAAASAPAGGVDGASSASTAVGSSGSGAGAAACSAASSTRWVIPLTARVRSRRT